MNCKVIRIYRSFYEYLSLSTGKYFLLVEDLDRFIHVLNEQNYYLLIKDLVDFQSITNFRSIMNREDLESYLDFLSSLINKYGLRDRKVFIACSLGKDSVAGFLILYELWHRGVLKNKPIALFTYIPILEDALLILGERFISKFGEFLRIIEIPKSKVIEYLKTRGYPTLDEKWCRALKMSSIKKYIQQHSKSEILYGECERVFESFKRLKMLYTSRPVQPGRILPVLYLSDADVFTICKMYGVLNKAYDYGLPRVSCFLCPYASGTNHILHVYLAHKYNVEIDIVLNSMKKLVNYYRNLGFEINNEIDVIKYGLFAIKFSKKDVEDRLTTYYNLIEDNVKELKIEMYINITKRYVYDLINKSPYYSIWENWINGEKFIHTLAKDLVKNLLS